MKTTYDHEYRLGVGLEAIGTFWNMGQAELKFLEVAVYRSLVYKDTGSQGQLRSKCQS